MPKHLNRFTVPSIFAVALASFAVAACGGSSSGDDAASDLAKYVPADAPVYIEGSVRPDQELADNVDSISTKLTGKSLSETIQTSLDEQQSGDLTYDADVEPWLGENAAMFVDGGFLDEDADFNNASNPDSASLDELNNTLDEFGPDQIGMIAETTDVEAAEAFIEKAAKEEGKASSGEYEGFSYQISADDDSIMGIVDDNLVVASTEDVFKSMVDASKGDSLDGSDTFAELIDKAPDGSLGNIYFASEEAALPPASETAGFDLKKFYDDLGIQTGDTGSLASLVPTENEISLVGVTTATSGLQGGDATALIESFPADTSFATGIGGVGENVTTVLNALNEQQIEGVLKKGDVDRFIKEASQGIDVPSIIESLQEIGFFVNGDSVQTMGGALVATTSDPEPLENALGTFSQLIGLAEDAKVKPLGGGMTGFRVKTPELPGRPVVIAIEGDRLVVAIGMSAAQQALTGEGESLADSDAYKAATGSLGGESVDLFANPDTIGALFEEMAAGDPDSQQVADVLKKFEYIVAGAGSDDQTSEFNLGLKD